MVRRAPEAATATVEGAVVYRLLQRAVAFLDQCCVIPAVTPTPDSHTNQSKAHTHSFFYLSLPFGNRVMESCMRMAHNVHVNGLLLSASASSPVDPQYMATLQRYLPTLVDHHKHHHNVAAESKHHQIPVTSRPPVSGTIETWVLIPPELSLVVSTVNESDPGRPSKGSNPSTRVWTRVPVTQGRRWSPFQGTVRLGVVPSDDPISEEDVRYSYGCYDEITEVHGLRVRHCNWVRFLRSSAIFTAEVNVVCSKVKGEPVYEAIRPIAAQTELVVFYLPGFNDEELFLPAVRSLRSSLFRRTMGLILEDSPLDLSISLLSRVLVPQPGGTSGSDGRQSVSSESTASSAGEPEPEASAMTAGAGRPTRQRPLLPCQVCGKAFDRPSLLNRHMRTHTGEKPHVCDVCGKGFSTSSSLNTHRRIHSGEKPHQCPVCGKRFTASSNLYYHRMTHIKEKPHKCALCSKSFPTPGDLKSHMYVHSGSWPFKCHVCSRGFSKHTNLKNHLFLHTGDKPHACELCNKRFALACNLRAHMKTHEGEPQEECSRCGKSYLLPNNNNNNNTTSDTGGICNDCATTSCNNSNNSDNTAEDIDVENEDSTAEEN